MKRKKILWASQQRTPEIVFPGYASRKNRTQGGVSEFILKDDQNRDTVPNLPGPQAQLGDSRRVTETVMVTFQGQLCGLKPNDPKTPYKWHSSGSRNTPIDSLPHLGLMSQFLHFDMILRRFMFEKHWSRISFLTVWWFVGISKVNYLLPQQKESSMRHKVVFYKVISPTPKLVNMLPIFSF